VHLNRNAVRLCRRLVRASERLRIMPQSAVGQARVIDCGVATAGGLEAGCRLAEICLAALGQVTLLPSDPAIWPGPAVMVATDHPVAACLASQYAGWEVSTAGYFAMLSGPMRAAAGREPLFDSIGYRETAAAAVGVLESDRLPPADVGRDLATKCGVPPESLTLLVAPITSQAGTVQVVARALETAMHKLHELGFDLARVESGVGVAPLPPVAADQITGIGRSNDAIIYGGQVTLYVRGDDHSLEATGARVPSSASPDHGLPFARVFEKVDQDFYRIDPHLFSPAAIVLANLDTGHSFSFGRPVPELIRDSFGAQRH